MQFVNEVLKKHKIGVKILSPELQKEVAELKEIIVKYNLAYKESQGQEDPELEKELDEMEDMIAKKDEELSIAIEKSLKPKTDEPKTDEPKADEPKSDEPKTDEPKSEAKVEIQNQEKKKDSTGWLIFAGLVFVATVGVVNVMKKRA
jgi:hypothetical protein